MMNPLIYRGVCANGRAGKLLLSLGLVSTVFVVAWLFLHLNWNRAVDIDPSRNTWDSYRLEVLGPLGLVVLTLQYAVGFLLMPINSGDTLPAERLRKSEEFFTTLPISSVSKTVGLLIGPNVLYLLLMAVFAIPATLLLAAGGFKLGQIVWSQVLLWTGSVSFSLLTILLCHSAKNKTMSWGSVLLILVVGSGMLLDVNWEEFSAMPALAYAPIQLAQLCFGHPMSSRSYFASGQYHFLFFAWSVPWQLGPMALHVLVALGCFAASSQRLRRPSSPPLPRWATLLVFAGLLFISVGFLADYWRSLVPPYGASPQGELKIYLIAWIAFLLVWAVSRCPSMQSMMEWMGKRAPWPSRLVSESLTDPRLPGYISLGIGWALAFLAVWAINVLYLRDLLEMGYTFWIMAVWAMFLIVYYSVVLICSLTMRRGGILVGGVSVFLLLAVPGIFSNVPGIGDSALVVTPFARGLQIPLRTQLSHADKLNKQLIEVTLAGVIMAFGALSAVAIVLAGLAKRSPRLRESAALA